MKMTFSMLPVLAAIVTLLILDVNGAIYIMDPNRKMVLEVISKARPCILHTDESIIEKIIRGVPGKHFQTMSANDLNDLKSSCQDIDQINSRGGFMFPGTKWCGPGNTARGYEDLGLLLEEDKCCRNHDHCTDVLEPGQCKFGICNLSPFTQSHCNCDAAFKKCLQETHTSEANIIGSIYFNLAQITCFAPRRTCPHYMRGCQLNYQKTMAPFSISRYFRGENEDVVSTFVNGIFRKFIGG